MASKSHLVDLSILILLGSALVFAIIELGLTAWWVSVSSRTYEVSYGALSTSTVRIRGYVLPPVAFLLFCSLWSILVSAALVTVPFVFRTRAPLGPKPLGFGTLALIFITMIFWLAGFAAYADYTWYGYATFGAPAAVMAFAVLSWLIYLALTVLTFLTAFGVVSSTRHGHHQLFRNKAHVDAAHNTTHPEAPAMTSVDRTEV